MHYLFEFILGNTTRTIDWRPQNEALANGWHKGESNHEGFNSDLIYLNLCS